MYQNRLRGNMIHPKFKSNKTILLVLHVCFIGYFQIVGAATLKAPYSNVCNTEACKNIASSILQKMNRSVNPCDNFYDFACGNFSKNAVISPTRSSNDLFDRLNDLVRENLRNDIEHQITNEDPEAFQKLLTYYKTCMDENQIEKTSSDEFLEILNKLGGCPVLLGKSYDDSKFEWQAVINNISKMGYSGSYFLSVYIMTDFKNNTNYLLNIDAPEFGISTDYLKQGLENDIVKAYFKFMVDMAEIFGANRDEAKLELEESFNFEMELVKISLPDAELQEEEKSNPMSISELQSKYPFIPWLKYINNWLEPMHLVTDDEVVIVNVPSFLKNLGSLLDRTPKRVLANYAMWRVALESAEQLNEKVRDANLELSAAIDGTHNKKPRWQSCVSYVANDLHLATSSLYASRNFDKDSKDGVSDLIERLRKSFKTILSEADWMDETTRNAALEKLEQMLPILGYPDEILDYEKIDNYYEDLTMFPESFLKTVSSCQRFQTKKDLMTFRKPVPRLDWTDYYSSSYTVNAFYTPSANVIRFLAGIIQGDFYNKDYPKYVNFGSIGSIIGHEMTHAFDSRGRKTNAIGNFVDWWNDDTEEKYLQKAQCIIDQYSNYTDLQVNLEINGSLTEGENIADNGGIKEAYLAYEAFEKENGQEPILPGFESFTTRQLFWISNANVWCMKYRDEFLRDSIVTDTHSPNRFRVIGPISNSPYFSKDFNCPAGSPMNPDNKCSVW